MTNNFAEDNFIYANNHSTEVRAVVVRAYILSGFDGGLGFDSRVEILFPISAAKLSVITD